MADQTQASSRFFTLPRELRDRIYHFVLSHDAKPPYDLTCAGSRRAIRDVLYTDCFSEPRRNVNNYLVCRQLRSELRQILHTARSQATVLSADIDIMVTDYVYIPTWTYLPPCIVRGKPVNLNARLRIFGTQSFFPDVSDSPDVPGCGFRTLMHLLESFIHRGPPLYYDVEPVAGRKPFVIDTLSVSVVYQTRFQLPAPPDATVHIFRMLKALANDGIAGGAIRLISARSEYFEHDSDDDDERIERIVERKWVVKDELDAVKARKWGSAGFYYAALVV